MRAGLQIRWSITKVLRPKNPGENDTKMLTWKGEKDEEALMDKVSDFGLKDLMLM